MELLPNPQTFIIIIVLSVWFPTNSVQIVKNSLFSAVTSFRTPVFFLPFYLFYVGFPLFFFFLNFTCVVIIRWEAG